MFKYAAFTSLVAHDLTRAHKFYTDLGLIKDANEDRYYLPKGGSILMNNQELPEYALGSLAVEVHNLKETLHKLEQNEIKNISTLETPKCHSAVLQDPDGNYITLHGSKATKKNPVTFHNTGQLEKIAYTTYRVTNFKTARKFYTKLGFKEGVAYEEYGYAEYDFTDGGCLSISTHSVMTPNYPHGTIVFEVQDLDELMSKFSQTQVVTEVFHVDEDVCRMGFVKDTEGNSIGLHQLKNKNRERS